MGSTLPPRSHELVLPSWSFQAAGLPIQNQLRPCPKTALLQGPYLSEINWKLLFDADFRLDSCWVQTKTQAVHSFQCRGVDWRVPMSSPKRSIAVSGNSVALKRTRLIVFTFLSQFPRDSVFLWNALELSCIFHPSMCQVSAGMTSAL